MEVRRGYKQTEVGVIPTEWLCLTIGDIAFPSTEKNTDRRNLPVLSCSKHYGFVDSLVFFSKQVFSDDISSYKIIRRGEFGFPANHIEEGSIGFQVNYDEAVVSPIYVVFRISVKVNGTFLYAILKTERYRQIFRSSTSASVDRRGSLRWPEFSSIKVPVPPLSEQIAIANAINDFDELIASLEYLTGKKRNIKKGMMQDLFTGKRRLPGFSGQWKESELRELISEVIDNRGRTPPISVEGQPVIEISSVYGEKKYPDYSKVSKYVDYETYKTWFRDGHPAEGDVLIGTVGSVGASAVMDDNIGCIAQNIVGIRFLSNYNSDFFYYFTNTDDFKSQVNAVLMGAVQPSLKVPHLLSFKIKHPDEDEQTAIAKILSDVDSEINELERKLAKYRMIKEGMMQELLTGKMRLV
jgi:restriction endonuclease S subunit